MKNFSLFPLFMGSVALATAQTVPPADAPVDKIKLGEFVVTSSALDRAVDEIAQPASVLGGPRLDVARQSSLGETLAGEPGVSSTYFGPGASRPVVRGLGGDRVRVLTSGVGTMDASVVSPDHAVSIDPLLIDRIELVRGPATLLYGGSAIGGVVNVIDSRVLEEKPARPVQGRVETRLGSAADERSGAGVFTGGAGEWAWRLDGFTRRTDDVRIPGFGPTDARRAELAAEGEPISHGSLINSATRSDGAGFGLTRFLGESGAAGHAGASYSGFNSRYGVVAEPDVTIQLRQRRWDAHAELLQPTAWLRAANFQLGVADYRHTEFEGADVGTVFRNQGYEGRVELLHAPVGPVTGAIGVQASRSDFEAIGDEAFLPPSVTTNRALFVYEEWKTGHFTWEIGTRVEQQKIAPETASGLAERDETLLSFSGGTIWRLPNDYALALSVTRSERAPNAQELFAHGPHVGTKAFEIGDAGLAAEKVAGVDLSLRKRAGFLSGAVTVFANRFDGFIFEQATGMDDPDSGLPIYRFQQGAARFVGAEFEVIAHVFATTSSRAELRFTADTVRAKNLDADRPLPRIPPSRFGVAADWLTGPWSFSAEVRTAARQDRTAENETATAGYALVNASITRRVELGGVRAEWFVRGTNLTDATARVHTSFLKDIAPLPGRDVTVGVRFAF